MSSCSNVGGTCGQATQRVAIPTQSELAARQASKAELAQKAEAPTDMEFLAELERRTTALEQAIDMLA